MSAPTGDGKQNSILKRNHRPVDEKSHNKSSDTKSSEKVHTMKLQEHDYVDFSTTLDTEFPVTREHERSTHRNANESMIGSIMKTTTKDPSKKHPVDQGMEYSDYYSYDEVLDDIAANKIQMKIDGPRNPNDRFIRQTVNASSSYNDDGNVGDVQPYYNDFHKYDKDSGNEDGSVNYPDNFPDDPSIDQSPGLDQYSPLSGTDQDPSFDYQLNYSPVFEDENENLDLSYSNTEEMPVAIQPETFDVVTLSNFQNNDEFQQPVIDLPRYPEGLNYLNRYENTNYGENVVESPMENKYSDLYKQSDVQLNSIPEVSRSYDNFDVPLLHDRYSNPLVSNFELSQIGLPHYDAKNQPDVERAELTDIRKGTSGDQWDHVVENPQSSDNFDAPQLSDGISNFDNGRTIQSQTGNGIITGLRVEGDETQPTFQRPVYSGKQDFSQYYNNRYGMRGEQILKSFSLQPNGVRDSENKNYDRPRDFPWINLPNPMEQPFGKVLESLGINVNGNSSGPSRELKSDLKEKVDPLPVENNPIKKVSGPSLSSTRTSLERPVEYILSPNHGWEKSRQDSGRNHEGSPRDEDAGKETKKLNDGTKVKEKHPRRQLTRARSKPRNDNLAQLLEQEREEDKNAPTMANETKEVANQILGTIIDELEDLKLGHAKTNNKREGLPCRLTGSWRTAQAGIMLDMKIVNRTIVVALSRLPAPQFHESFLNGTWNMSGHIPFHRGAPFTLTAVDNQTNSIAVFVGACRVCQGVDTIAGVWSIARQPRDCRDFQIATSVYNDVFHKTTLSSMKEKHHGIDSSSSNATNSLTTTTKNGKRNG